jgi:DNA-directed RNA polymerase subunit RPC12/RpoP
MAFAAARCPKCEKQFRLIWKIGGRKLDLQQRLRLTCPACGAVFEQVCVKLPAFSAGREFIPLTATVDESCLVNSPP